MFSLNFVILFIQSLAYEDLQQQERIIERESRLSRVKQTLDRWSEWSLSGVRLRSRLTFAHAMGGLLTDGLISDSANQLINTLNTFSEHFSRMLY